MNLTISCALKLVLVYLGFLLLTVVSYLTIGISEGLLMQLQHMPWSKLGFGIQIFTPFVGLIWSVVLALLLTRMPKIRRSQSVGKLGLKIFGLTMLMFGGYYLGLVPALLNKFFGVTFDVQFGRVLSFVLFDLWLFVAAFGIALIATRWYIANENK